MANSYVEYTTAGTGTNGLGQATFSYSGMDVLSADHVFCKIQSYDGSSLSWAEASVASRNATAKTITLNSVPSGTVTKVRVYRNTVSTPLVDFVDGARLTENDLDTAYKQGLLATQEVKEDAAVNGNTGVTNLTLTGLTSVQNLTATGTVVIPSGSAATHFYREGTWTATARSGNTGTGTYTKIGNLVWFSVTINNIASTGTTNEMNISGLPYTSANNSIDSAVSIGMEYKINAPASTTTLRAKVGANSTSVFFYWSKDDLAYSISTCADFDASDALINISGVYQIA